MAQSARAIEESRSVRKLRDSSPGLDDVVLVFMEGRFNFMVCAIVAQIVRVRFAKVKCAVSAQLNARETRPAKHHRQANPRGADAAGRDAGGIGGAPRREGSLLRPFRDLSDGGGRSFHPGLRNPRDCGQPQNSRRVVLRKETKREEMSVCRRETSLTTLFWQLFENVIACFTRVNRPTLD